MVFTAQQAADIAANTLKVSADGPVSTHSDVETMSPAVGDLLSWNGTNWVNIPSITGITVQQAAAIAANTLKVSADGPVSTHSDVETTSPAVGDLLSWNGTNWVNIPAIVGISAQQAADIETNNAKVSASGSINTHNDVQTGTAAVGDLLSWNGTNWVNIPAITGITIQQAADIAANTLKVSADGSVSTHSDVEVLSPVNGDLMVWNGTNWVNESSYAAQLVTTDGSGAPNPADYTGTYLPQPGTSRNAFNLITQGWHFNHIQTGLALLPLGTYVSTTAVNTEVLITACISYERLLPGAFLLLVDEVEVGSNSPVAGRFHGIAPQLSGVGLKNSSFSYKTMLGAQGIHSIKVALRYDDTQPLILSINESIPILGVSLLRGSSSISVSIV